MLAFVYMHVHVPVNSGLVGNIHVNQVGKLKLSCRSKI